jgi:hypothetical protein
MVWNVLPSPIPSAAQESPQKEAQQLEYQRRQLSAGVDMCYRSMLPKECASAAAAALD